jgi:hypothetical protein
MAAGFEVDFFSYSSAWVHPGAFNSPTFRTCIPFIPWSSERTSTLCSHSSSSRVPRTFQASHQVDFALFIHNPQAPRDKGEDRSFARCFGCLSDKSKLH